MAAPGSDSDVEIPVLDAAVAHSVGEAMSDGGLGGLRPFLRELVQEGRTQHFIDTARVMRDYELDSEVDAFLLVVRSGSPALKPLAQLELGRIAMPVDTETA